MFETLKQVSRKDGTMDSMSELGEMEALRLQIYMQKQAQMYEMLSSMMKKQNEMSSTIIGNIR